MQNLQKWCLEYIRIYKASSLKASTLESYLFSCKHIPDFLSLSVTDLELQQLVNDMYLKGLSLSSIKHTMTIIRQALRKAYQRGMIGKMPSFDTIEYPRSRAKRIEAFSMEETDRLGSVLCEPGRFNQLFLFLLLTGVRVGEALALKWSDVDLRNKKLTILRTNYRGLIQEAKTINSVRTIPLTAETRYLLRKRLNAAHPRANSEILQNDDLVFNFSYYSARGAFKRICERAGVMPRGIHALRHTYATCALRSGVNIKTLSALLGHSSISVTLDIYCSVELFDKQKEADKIRFFSPSKAPQNGLNVFRYLC